ncbi:MAG: hypothetical protein ACLGHC_01855 [Alphaproteobacteria bacterium]
MRLLGKRVKALEERDGGAGHPPFWVRIIGRTEAEARAAYEAEHGPIAPEAGIIFHRIVTPSREQST